LAGCQGFVPRIIDASPDCPKWNTDEWISFYYTIDLAEAIIENNAFYGPEDQIRDIMPGVLATGALLQHCFPEEFEIFDDVMTEPTKAPAPTRQRHEYKPTFDGKGYQINV
jgi:hypothetical protein